jgi:hypothetical protein
MRVQEQVVALRRHIEEMQRRKDEELARLSGLQQQRSHHQERRETYQRLLEQAEAIETACKNINSRSMKSAPGVRN